MVQCICKICMCGRHHCPHRSANITGMGEVPCRVTEYTTRYKEHKLDKTAFFKPHGEPLPQGNMEDKTIYRLDYPSHEPKPLCRHVPEVWKKPPGNIEGLTSYKKDYAHRQGEPALSIRHQPRPLNTGKFQADPTYTSDYKEWKVEPRKIRQVKSWSPPCNKMEGKSTFTRDYSYKEPRATESFKPQHKYLPDGQFDNTTRYRDEFVEHELPAKSPREKRPYNLPIVPIDDLTITKRDYQEKNIPHTDNYAPNNTYTTPKEQMEGQTTFRNDYPNWPPGRPPLHQPEKYKKPPGKMNKDTTHKLAYRDFPIKPTPSFKPKRAGQFGGKFYDESSYKQDFKPWKIPEKEVMIREYIPNTVPFKGMSTTKAHFVAHPAVQSMFCKPKEARTHETGPIDDNTTYRLEYHHKEPPVCPAIYLDTTMTPYKFIKEEDTGHRFYTKNGD